MFKNRKDAGRQLAEKLASYQGTDAVVIALPRGGVVVGYEVAKRLFLPLDVIVTRKIGHPTSSEYAIGAVDENGMAIYNEAETPYFDQTWLKGETSRQQEEAERRSLLYRAGKKPLDVSGKTVIIVDDGIATGFTMSLAFMSIKKQQPQKVVVAVPVASPEAALRFEKDADEFIVLENPKKFQAAVGAHYKKFEQVEDEEVIHLLQ